MKKIAGLLVVVLLAVLAGCGAKSQPNVQSTSIPGVIERETPKTVGVYIADGESSAMVILQENNDFALQGSEYISFIPSGKYRIDNDKLFLSMGDYDIIFLLEEDRMIFESGTWLEYLVEVGAVFRLTDKYR